MKTKVTRYDEVPDDMDITKVEVIHKYFMYVERKSYFVDL